MIASEILGENWLRINVSIYCNQILANFNNVFYRGNIIKNAYQAFPIRLTNSKLSTEEQFILTT